MLLWKDAVLHIYLYIRAKDYFSLKTWMNLDSLECRKILLSYNPVPRCRRREFVLFLRKFFISFSNFCLFLHFQLNISQKLR